MVKLRWGHGGKWAHHQVMGEEYNSFILKFMKEPWWLAVSLPIATITVLLSNGTAIAHSGCCAGHGGVNWCICADGTLLSATCAPYYPSCSTSSSSSSISNRTSSVSASVQSQCHVRGALPDSTCTPGVIFHNATKATICVLGYTKTVRDVSESLKNKVFSEYGITQHNGSTYEVDHLIPLELGGSNDVKNLWPEAATEPTDFHSKDKLENYLHSQVCKGSLTLQKAQNEIATNWLSAYSSMNGSKQ